MTSDYKFSFFITVTGQKVKIYLSSCTKQYKQKLNKSDTCDVKGAMNVSDLLAMTRGPLSLSEVAEDPERNRAYTLIQKTHQLV